MRKTGKSLNQEKQNMGMKKTRRYENTVYGMVYGEYGMECVQRVLVGKSVKKIDSMLKFVQAFLC